MTAENGGSDHKRTFQPPNGHRPYGTELETETLFTVHITNIPDKMTKRGVENLCQKFGTVVCTDAFPRSGCSPLRFCNVSFGSISEAEAAISNLRGHFGIKIFISKSKEARNATRQQEQAISEKHFKKQKFLTEFVRKRGIGPLSFHDVPLKGKPKVFQKIAATRAENVFVPVQDITVFEVTDFSKFEITEEVEEAKAGEAMQIKTTRRIEIQEDIELASFKPFVFGRPVVIKQTESECSTCKKPSVLLCNLCQSFGYCSKDCRRQHWLSGHREHCKQIDESCGASFRTLLSKITSSGWRDDFRSELANVSEGFVFGIIPELEAFLSGKKFPALMDVKSANEICFEMERVFRAKDESETVEAAEISVGKLFVGVYNGNCCDRLLVTRIEGNEIRAIKIDFGDEVKLALDKVKLFNQVDDFADVPASGLIFESSKKMEHFNRFCKKVLDQKSAVRVRLNHLFFDQNGRLDHAECSILDNKTRDRLADYRVTPWYKHDSLTKVAKSSIHNNETANLDEVTNNYADKEKKAEAEEETNVICEAETEPDLFKTGEKLVWLNFGKFSNELIVARLEDGKAFEEISKALQLDPKETLKKAPVEGQMVSCRRSGDGLMYRARINQVFSKRNEVKVSFVDTKRTSIESYQNIFEMPKNVEHIPALAFTIHLIGVSKKPVFGSLNHLLPLLRSPLTVIEEKGSNLALRHPNGSTINQLTENIVQEFISGNQRGSVNGQINYDESQVVAFPVDPDLEQGAIVTFANSPNEIFLCPSNQIGVASHLMEQIQNYCAIQVASDVFPEHGKVYLVQSTEDDQWYRGVCLWREEAEEDSYDTDKVAVMFADFGCTEMVPVKNLRHISEFLKSFPFMAAHCVLDGFQESDKDLTNQPIKDAIKEMFPAFSEEIRVKVLATASDGNQIIRVPKFEKTLNDSRKTEKC